ncbi:initiator tRNA phosphoribosyl transferase-domain-containing protein [Gymnopilus junonius]|uniref:Initiator tRNA phosphoribosyl transferase-domain-containing protein n=1 Tax=Gymnopilus junonius TaxID=109634 RepID=A0A9P5TQJ4_GYMJU|nr:initiator tRNA phosphoribosyl transferase-domain-containing protein [Gymnopilus junonius]
MDSVDALTYLRKESLDIFNRLHSVREDIQFVYQIHAAYPDTPILPNLRCGSWYTDPKIAVDTPAYFKSTDGHFNNWSFNLRRANLHLLPLIVDRNGIILVDSTRSGKRIPDALSKTVPIWCAVINRALLIRHINGIPNVQISDWDIALYTPPSTVSLQEHNQIELRLDEWARLLAASSFSLPPLPYPLRPVWITPATTAFPTIPTSESRHGGFLPIVCVSASKQIDQGVERRTSGFSYIQGSGDDHELWGMGLSPELFWGHYEELLKADRARLPEIVSQIVSGQRLSSSPCAIHTVLQHLAIVYLILAPAPDQSSLPPSTKTTLYVPVIPGKKGQTDFLQSVLPQSIECIRQHLADNQNICVACESGKDLSVGVILAAIQLFFTDDGKLVPFNRIPYCTKKHSDSW